MMVGLDAERLTLAPGITPMDDQVPAMLRDAPPGSIHESCPAATAIIAALAERLERQGGAMLVVDYGYSGPALGDTLQAMRAHAFADPMANAGEADLTAHVDFTALAAAAPGLVAAGPVAQGDWLTRLGIDARTAALAARNPARANELQAQRDRLVKADAMGHLLRVLALHAKSWPMFAGFDA
jgi:NADH dehydrogenase [ubiquinone] 1 alpha subcomplex assembly factor 7